MSGLFQNVRSEFHVVGELIDRRLVTSDKVKDWQLHVFKIAGKGCTLEVQVSKDEYERGALNQAYQITGSITVENGRTKLIGEKVAMLAAAPSRAAS